MWFIHLETEIELLYRILNSLGSSELFMYGYNNPKREQGFILSFTVGKTA
ncbi:hypothetical protein SAMN05421858_2520 [Haladaptatus litoreus]|uniref:Uncharacterized protein n=1 Tax=Haladaptatus litoreus TaxID=553468 RepID=A0A1N7BF31_9EURY|nr:hypothetical protein SAMN05421858_2520 [Haladaptatus litoreus]